MADSPEGSFPHFIVLSWKKPETRAKINRVVNIVMNAPKTKVAVIRGREQVLILLDQEAKEQLSQHLLNSDEIIVYTGVTIPEVH